MAEKTFERLDNIPPVILRWCEQLRGDRFLHEVVRAACREGEAIDVDLTVLVRGKSGRVVMEPKIVVRR